MRSVIFCSLLFLAVTTGQSVKSCGGPNDHFKNATFTVSPDPIDKSKPLTIEGMGTLDEIMTGGTLKIDLNIKALGIISTSLKKSAPFSIAPGLPAGAQKLVIGPFSLPSVPGTTTISGQVSGTDAKGEPVFCVALNIDVYDEAPLKALPEVPELPPTSFAILSPEVAASPVSDCGQPADHLKNRTFSSTGGVFNLAGDLDETVPAGELDVDMEIKVLFISVPIKMNIPFTISPPIPSGTFKVSVGPISSEDDSTVPEVDSPEITVHVSGNIKLNDAKKEEIACVAIKVN